MLKIAICFILAYLIGSFPSAYVIGKVFFKQDVRQLGSGNIGTTNTFRVFGVLPGITVLALDIFKGTLGASLPMFFQVPGKQWMIIIGLAAVLGHCFPIFLHFHGGKAVATASGILLAYNPPLFLFAFSMFTIIVLLTSTVSIASLISLPVLTIAIIPTHDPYFLAAGILVTIIVYWRHLSNIKRIFSHQENIIHVGLVYYLSQKKSKK
ncbi:glycerol-3-phosphate 1-O-acyltransferase PlsY [Bombilactobacillus thymidiniphilus]|uniref:Glycerol-3-phosphate acyltransferase n=1 Tax=Bombilactobacillus thymidiniphilus TaxID=2923363 RepID=A0ABY4PFK6_9LACO|nr:glycerol-3-phosphate 1-O-acyltransferase PlsY [Bombilactobacillus thymidiniphilus]UQS84392.1 glycerol-3-phosphate 1-O-acyltransferase PlsY [Bombilactobacillus thymidiniphilus]